MRILLECLVKNADDDQPAAASRCQFGQLLEKMDVGAVPCGRLEELAQLVDEQHQTAAGTGIARGNGFQRLKHGLFRPGGRDPVPGQKPRRFDGLADHLCRPVTPPGDRQHPPAAAPWWQGLVEKG